jgi:hypothetical protein
MVYWTTQCLRLRPDAPLPSVEWQNLTAADVETLSRVGDAWLRWRARRGVEVGVPRGVEVGNLDYMIDGSLAEILTHVLNKLTPAAPDAKPKSTARQIAVAALAKVGLRPCGDGSCMFGPPDGMATQGGCRCFDKWSAFDGEKAPRGYQSRDGQKLAQVIRDLAGQLAEGGRG